MVEIICNHLRPVEHYKNCLLKNGKEAASDQRCLCPAILISPHFGDVDIRGYTAFHTALVCNRHDIVTILLRCLPSLVEDALRPTSENLTPQLLLEGKPLRWRRPLHYALLCEQSLHGMYKILVEGGANVNSKDSDGRTPLMLSKSCDDTEAAEFLLAHGAKSSSSTPSKQDGNKHRRSHTRRRKATLQD